MPVSAVDAIHPAIEHAKKQLFAPFRFGQWARLALVGLLAGEMSSGGSCNIPSNLPTDLRHLPRNDGSQAFLADPFTDILLNHPWVTVGAIILAVVVFFVIGTIFMYISSRMRFVLFDSVLTRQCHVRRNWRARASQGWRLFVWQVILSTISFALLLVVLGIAALFAWRLGWFEDPRSHVIQLVVVGVGLVVLLLLLSLVVAVVNVMTKDFVVPQMAFEDIAAIDAWRRFWPQVRTQMGGYAGYVGMKIVLAIAAAVVFGIIGVIVIVVLMIPIGALGVAAFFSGKAMGLAWNPGTITFAVIFGVIALGAIVFAGALVNTPSVIFFQAYSMYFFAPRYEPLARALWGAPSAPPAPPAPPFEPPPIAPAPAS